MRITKAPIGLLNSLTIITAFFLNVVVAIPHKQIVLKIAKYEKKYNMPRGILLAIALHESGMRVKVGGKVKVVICPYAINVAGKSYYFRDRQKAETFITNYLKIHKNRSIDIGVAQLNLRYHGQHFASPIQMFDLEKNIAYAAQHLYKLKQNCHSWTLALGRYHNSNYKINQPYKNQVFKKWRHIRRKMFANSFGLTYKTMYS